MPFELEEKTVSIANYLFVLKEPTIEDDLKLQDKHAKFVGEGPIKRRMLDLPDYQLSLLAAAIVAVKDPAGKPLEITDKREFVRKLPRTMGDLLLAELNKLGPGAEALANFQLR